MGLTVEVCVALPSSAGGVIVEIEFAEKRSPSVSGRQLPTGIPVTSAPTATQSTPQLDYPTFNSQQLDRQLQRYLAYLARFGPPDILIVGSSRALQGVDPVTLSKALAQQGYPNLQVFNFGINGATAQVVDWVLRRLLTPDQLPRIIVWADGARALNSGRMDQTFHKITTSQGYKMLSSGVRPPIPQAGGFELGQICMDMLPVIIPAPSRSQDNNVTPTGAKNLPSAKNLPCNQPLKVLVHQAAVNRPTQTLDQEALGFQVVNTRFNPKTYFQRYPEVPGGYDTNYRDFTLEGRQTEAFDRVIRFANSRKISLVFVNLPLTSTYLDLARSAYEGQFRSRMQRFAHAQKLQFQDLVAQRSLNQNHYFADPSHLNRYGAIAVATQISQKLTTSFSDALRRALNQPDERLSYTHSTRCETGCFYLLQFQDNNDLK
ncbi:MAG: hypothetical protein HC866_02585 [Leptolyngbyaceae cyanobacterium RU_5_1]|nr:hypothetical protein [Leptolyngbyaceae cyanobacterium RU_5_1]